jgi:Methyltransferase domain
VHSEAYAWVAAHATTDPVDVLDLGGRNVNGSPRPLFPNAASYTVLDILDGPGVDVVADAATWQPGRAYDVVLACELFEHTAVWPRIVHTAYAACRPGGRFVVTTAAPGRAVHSGVDGGPALWPGEHYANIEPAALELALEEAGFTEILVDVQPVPADVRAVATRPV